MMTWTCVTRPDTLIRIGQVDFFDSTPENCLVSDKHAVAMWKPAEKEDADRVACPLHLLALQLHSAAAAVTPSSIFEVLDLGDGYVGFRSFANGKFVKVSQTRLQQAGTCMTDFIQRQHMQRSVRCASLQVTPPASGKSSDPWWLDLASPVPGLAERFRLDGPLVYNELLQGHLKCGTSGGQGGAAVLGKRVLAE